jgi:diguanylate cyclase (GGDEF)-like protein
VYVAGRVRQAIERAEFLTGSSTPPRKLTISIGVAVYDRDARLKRELIEASDAALYTAKHAGRNRVACYSEIARPEKRDAS